MPTLPPLKLTAVYVRDSDVKAVATQQANLEKYLAFRQPDWPEPAEWFKDSGVMSETFKNRRKGYLAMLEGLQAGRLARIVAWNLEALTPTPTQLIEFKTFCQQAGVQLVLVHTKVDTANPTEARVFYAVLDELEKLDKNKFSEAFNKEGRKISNGRPKKKINIEEVLRLRELGHSQNAIATQLSTSQSSIARVLKNLKPS